MASQEYVNLLRSLDQNTIINSLDNTQQYVVQVQPQYVVQSQQYVDQSQVQPQYIVQSQQYVDQSQPYYQSQQSQPYYQSQQYVDQSQQYVDQSQPYVQQSLSPQQYYQDLLNDKSREYNQTYGQPMTNQQQTNYQEYQPLIIQTSNQPNFQYQAFAQPIQQYNNENIDLNNKIKDLENKLKNVSNSDFGCELKIEKTKKELNDQIKNIKEETNKTNNSYLNLLFDYLFKNQVITQNEIDNIKKKLANNDIDLLTIISYLENKKATAKIIVNNGQLNFNDVLTNKWQVPLPRPPVCISDVPIKLTNNDNNSNNFASFK